MSSPPTVDFPTISGGLPTSVDLGPSILFTILYAVILPAAIWRTIQYRRPGRLLYSFLRLSLFCTIRIVTYVIRAVEAHQASGGNYSPQLGLFIAQQILLGIGFIVLVGLLVELVKSHLLRTDDAPGTQAVNANAQAGMFTLPRIVRLMHLALIAAIILGIVAGSQYGNAISNPSVAAQVKTERIASTALALAACGASALISLLLLVTHAHLPRQSSAYLLLTSCVMVIVPAYRLSTLETSTTSVLYLISSAEKVKFWILQALMEWIVSILLLAVDVRIWFFAGGMDARVAMGKEGGNGAYAGQVPVEMNGAQSRAGGY